VHLIVTVIVIVMASTAPSYNRILRVYPQSAKCSVPVYKPGVQKHWWTPELDELKQLRIDATAVWKVAENPRSVEMNANRVRIKLKYNNTIKLLTLMWFLIMNCMIICVKRIPLGFGSRGVNLII